MKYKVDTEEFEKRTEILRNTFYRNIELGFYEMLHDKSDGALKEAMEMLSDKLNDCMVEDMPNFVAQAAIVVQTMNDEVDWEEE